MVNAVTDLCDGCVLGVFDLTSRGGPERAIVVQARNRAQLRTFANRLCADLGGVREGRVKPLRVSTGPGPWVAVDLGSAVVHLFTRRSAMFYDLPALYAGLAVA